VPGCACSAKRNFSSSRRRNSITPASFLLLLPSLNGKSGGTPPGTVLFSLSRSSSNCWWRRKTRSTTTRRASHRSHKHSVLGASRAARLCARNRHRRRVVGQNALVGELGRRRGGVLARELALRLPVAADVSVAEFAWSALDAASLVCTALAESRSPTVRPGRSRRDAQRPRTALREHRWQNCLAVPLPLVTRTSSAHRRGVIHNGSERRRSSDSDGRGHDGCTRHGAHHTFGVAASDEQTKPY
jgi:hypothetical protein